MPDVVNDVVINYKSTGLDQVGPEIKQVSTGLDGIVVSSTGAEKATASLENRFASLERQFSTSAGNADKFAKVQDSVNKAVAQNPELQGRANEVLAAAATKYGLVEAATKGLADAHKGLDSYSQAALHSVRSLAEMLASGVSPTRALSMEMGRLSYAASGPGGISGAFSDVGAMLKNMISPTTAIAVGIAAVGAAALLAANQLDKLQVSANRAISGAGQRTGTTVEDINAFVAQNAGASTNRLSGTEARDLAEGLTKNGDIVISKLHDMSAAVVGFANQTGKSVADASKVFEEFGTDPVKALQVVTEAFGPLSAASQKAFDDALKLGDNTAALNVVLDAFAGKTKAAADNAGVLEKAWRAVLTTLGTQVLKPEGIDTQIANVKKQLDAAIASAPSTLFKSDLSDQIQKLTDQLAKLQAQKEKVNLDTLNVQMAKLATDAGQATAALTPQIAQMDALEKKIEQLNAAREAGVSSKYGADADAAALQAARNELQTLQESQDTAARLNDQVAMLRDKWQGVSGAAAETLQIAQNQLPVIQATTAAEAQAAQYTADIANAMLKGASAADAQALAAAKLAASQAAADAAVEKQIQSLEDSTRLIKAQAQGMGDVAERSIAYDNAIRSGASETEAAALSSAMLSNQMAKAAANADAFRQAMMSSANMAAGMSNFLPMGLGGGQPNAIDPGTGGFLSGGFNVAGGQTGASISTLPLNMLPGLQSTLAGKPGGSSWLPGGFGLEELQAKTDVMNQQAADQKAADLKNSIDSLTKSTDALNATNQDLLSPYYTQDPRTSHIGFRSQGMASGGYVDVPGGSSANDNMLLTMPVASGERVYVDPMTGTRGAGGGSLTINISSPVLIQGNANKDDVGRTMFQNNQNLAKQLRQAAQ
jgi:Prophage tail length tape measure protein